MKIHIQNTVFCFLLGSLFLPLPPAQAQQDSQFTQYMYNPSSINPAYAGAREMLSLTGIYRNQWIGLDGAPETLSFSAHSPLGYTPLGAGLNFISDKIGPASESLIAADVSYTIELGRSLRLAFGVKGGLSLLNVNPNKLLIYDPNDYDLYRRNYSAPVVGAGLFLHSDRWYVGLSSPNFLETNHYDDVNVSTATEKMHLYLLGGYVFPISPDLKLKPSLMVKAVPGAPIALDVSANALYMDRFTLGVAYRLDAAISGLAAFQVNRYILLGYSYDYETTELSRYGDGTHEIFLRFEWGRRNDSKVNPRFF